LTEISSLSLHDALPIYDEMFPMSAYWNATCVATFYWQVQPYVKSAAVTQCPSAPEAMDVPTMFAGAGGACASTPRFTSYSVNLRSEEHTSELQSRFDLV